jgi:hypothetical protein
VGTLYGSISRWNTLKINRKDYTGRASLLPDGKGSPDSQGRAPACFFPAEKLVIVLRVSVQRTSI